MILYTPRLTLAPTNLTYLITTFAYAGDRESNRFMMFLPYDTLAETAQVIAASQDEWRRPLPSRCDFVVLLSGHHIGGVTLYFEQDRTQAELGWLLHRDYWRHGYAQEAAQAVMDYAVNTWKVRRLFACCDSENTPSWRLMERLGMQRVSLLPGRHNRSMPGQERMELLYELIINN